MTHVRNMQGLSQVVVYCTGLGGKYNPGETNLQVEALTGKLDEVRKAIDQTIEAGNHFADESNSRKQSFDSMLRTAYQVVLTLEGSGTTPEKLDDVRQLYRQLTGRSPRNRAPIPSDEALAQGKVRRSVSQAAYAHKAVAFAKLVESVSTEPLYAPVDPAISVEALETMVSELGSVNYRVILARAEWNNSLKGRNQALYAKPTGAVIAARRVKRYIRSAFGLRSAEYAPFKGIVFTKPGK